MTDKEMAEEQIKKWDSLLYSQMYPVVLVKDFIRKAYIAGLEAGRPQWHNVADGDLPPCEKGYYTINVLTNYGDIAYYDYNENCWIVEPSSAEIDPPIAWCEIPKYERSE